MRIGILRSVNYKEEGGLEWEIKCLIICQKACLYFLVMPI